MGGRGYWPRAAGLRAAPGARALRRLVRWPATPLAAWRLSGRRLERRMVWMVGSPRSGSTWLYRMLRDAPRTVPLHEPMIGAHLGVLAESVLGVRPRADQAERLRLVTARATKGTYFFSDSYRRSWQPELRRLLLRRLGAQARDTAFQQRASDPVVVIKEPNGSEGADVLMSALPKSRMLLLLRDGRDVIDSLLDATSSGGWLARAGYEAGADGGSGRSELIRGWAYAWVARTDAVLRAYEAHPQGLRMKLRYEDLLDDPAAGLRALADWLDLGLDAGGVDRVVAAHSFEASGGGKGGHVRAARPGLWRENLTASEQDEVGAIMGGRLAALGYEG